jgi:hypothetical protein
MEVATRPESRPLAVKLALAVLLWRAGVAIIPRVLYGNWNSPLVDVKFGSEFAMLLLPLWFILRGRNWARWLLVAFAFGGFCVSLPRLMRHVDAHSVSWIVAYSWRNLLVVAALVALFLPKSNRWFRRDENANVA